MANYPMVNRDSVYFPDYSDLRQQVKPMEKPPKYVTDTVQPEDLGEGWDEEPEAPEALPVKRRGRPPKNPQPPKAKALSAYDLALVTPAIQEEPAKRGPGRPRKDGTAPKPRTVRNELVEPEDDEVDEDWDIEFDAPATAEQIQKQEDLKVLRMVIEKPDSLRAVIRIAGNLYTRRDQLSVAESLLVDRIVYLEAEETKVRILRDALAAEVKSLTRKLKAPAPPERRMDTKVPILEPAFIVDPEPEDT